MSFQFGRITGLNEPNVWSNHDGTITITGSYKATSLTDGLTRRDQLLGYINNPDEPVVPVIITGEPRVNGYYRVLGVQVDTDEFVRKQGNLYDYVITLQLVQGFIQPAIESVVNGALLTNVVGAVATDMTALYSGPCAPLDFLVTDASGVGHIIASGLGRNTSDGAVVPLYVAGNLPSGVVSCTSLPANYYLGACRFEQGSPLATIVGRNQVQVDLVNWRLSNGLVRVSPNAVTGKLDVSHWMSASWATAKTYQISGSTTYGLINSFSTLTVLRNSPEEVAIRLTGTAVTNPGPVYIDISLRRGDRLARIFFRVNAVAAEKWKVARSSVEAATAITYSGVTLGGIRATANDSDGNRYVLLSYQAAVTSDLVNGALTQNAVQSTMDIGIGSEIGGSGAGTADTAINLATQYIAAQSESQRVVAR